MRVKLEDVCERGTSSLMQKDIVDKNGKYPVYGASGRIGSMETYQQEHQTVAVVKDGAGIGRTMLLPEKSSIIGTMQYLIPKNCIEPEYLYYAVKYMHLEKYFSGATIPHIYFRDYKTEEFNLHNKTEQQEIISTLKRVEAVISNRREQLAMLDELVKARFVEMFGDPISNPFGFKVKTLQKMIDDGTIMYHLDGNHGSDYPRNEEFVECGVPYISANCIVHNDVNLKLAKHLTEERASKLRKGIAQNGDVLFAHNATVGPVAILYTDDEKVILGTSLTAYRCDKERMVPDYLKAYMQSEGFVCQYTKDMKQTTRNQVPITAQRKFLFVIPPLSLQNQFAAFAAEVDKSKFGEVIYMKKSASRIVGLVMLIIAVAFIMFAVNHPEKSFPWNNTITWLLYGIYFLVTVVLLIAPKMKK